MVETIEAKKRPSGLPRFNYWIAAGFQYQASRLFATGGIGG
jgi:hypothetical protein